MTKNEYINDLQRQIDELKEEYKIVSWRYLPLLYCKIKEFEKLKTVKTKCLFDVIVEK